MNVGGTDLNTELKDGKISFKATASGRVILKMGEQTAVTAIYVESDNYREALEKIKTVGKASVNEAVAKISDYSKKTDPNNMKDGKELSFEGFYTAIKAQINTEAEKVAKLEAELAKRKGEDPFLILLDGVTDPHNLGAIIRSAECVGAHGVIVPERRSVGLTPAAVKASAGAVEHMKVARVVNLSRTIEELKQRNIWTYALDMDGVDYEKVNFKGGVALVVGSEGRGVSRLVKEQCDFVLSLPMAGQINSLNASVACGIVLYEAARQRQHIPAIQPK